MASSDTVLPRGASPRGPTDDRSRAALYRWLVDHGEVVTGPVVVSRICAGRTNLTSMVTDQAGHRWVLRERISADARTFSREALVLQSLARLGQPVAHLVGHHSSGRGRDFLVTAWSEGDTLHDEIDARRLPATSRYARGIGIIDTLAALHRIQPDLVGLPRFAVGHLDRQLTCMSDLWVRSGTSGVHDSAWRAVRTRLIECRPLREPRARLLHGDFRLANLVFDNDRVCAVLDWERCTAGDPLTDVAWLLNGWRSSDERSSCPASPTRVGGFPTRAELVSAYRDRVDIAVEDLNYHRGMAYWCAATLMQAAETSSRTTAGVLYTTASEFTDEIIAAELLAAAWMLRRPR